MVHTHNEADIKILNSGVASALLERMLLWTGVLSGFVNYFCWIVGLCTVCTSRSTRQLVHNRNRLKAGCRFQFSWRGARCLTPFCMCLPFAVVLRRPLTTYYYRWASKDQKDGWRVAMRWLLAIQGLWAGFRFLQIDLCTMYVCYTEIVRYLYVLVAVRLWQNAIWQTTPSMYTSTNTKSYNLHSPV